MSGGFVKLYGTILDSSVWSEPHHVVRVWVAMLVMADQHGVVEAALPGLARRANVTREECEAALLVLASPDPDSKSPEHEGRRVEQVPGGWLVLNYKRYRELRTDKQIADAERQRRKYERDTSQEGVSSHGPHATSPQKQKQKEKQTTTTAAKDAAEAEFETFWKAYPSRGGSGNPKHRARKAWNARTHGNLLPVAASIMEGLARYTRFLTATGKIGTEYVMQAATFLGPDERYLEPWGIPREKGAPPPEAVAKCPVCGEQVKRSHWTPHWLAHRTRQDEPSFGDNMEPT